MSGVLQFGIEDEDERGKIGVTHSPNSPDARPSQRNSLSFVLLHSNYFAFTMSNARRSFMKHWFAIEVRSESSADVFNMLTNPIISTTGDSYVSFRCDFLYPFIWILMW